MTRGIGSSGRETGPESAVRVWLARRRVAGITLLLAVLAIAASVGVVVARADLSQVPGAEDRMVRMARSSERIGFVPRTKADGDTVAMPVTFTDGRRVELRYPRTLDLAGLTFETGGSVAWSVRRDPQRCCSKVVSISHATIKEVYGNAEPIATYRGVDGTRVRYYHGSDAGRTVRLDYLVFQFGPWLVEVYDLQQPQPGDFEDRMSDDERATWAASLDGETDEHGFLVLRARPPLEVERSATAILGGPGASTYLLLNEGGCGYEESDTPTPRLVADPVGVGAAWCDPRTGLHVYVAGRADFVESVVDGLVIRALTPGFKAVSR